RIPTFFGMKQLFIFGIITSKCEHIIDSQKVQINQGIFSILSCKSATNDMWDCIYAVFLHNSSTNSHSTRAFTGSDFHKRTIGTFLLYIILSVISNIDKGWIELFERVYAFIDALYRVAL